MADVIGNLVVRLKADASDIDQGIDQAKGKFDGFKSVVQGVAMGAGIAVANFAVQAGQALIQFGADSVAGASDLNETLSKTNVLFGDSAGAVTAFAATAATQFGQSQQQALDAAATFATFGSAAGLAGDDLVEFSTGFVGLSSDLASFNNTTPEQAIEAIGAALRGESEPLRAYGVLLDDASMRQKALEMGIISTTKDALTPQQKVLAAQALIYEQTSAAQGDFARTSDGLANQQRILDAQMANLQATIGQALLPVVLTFTRAANDLAQQVLPPLADFMRSTVTPAFEQVAGIIRNTVGPAVEFISRLFSGLGSNMQAQANGPMAYLRQWFEQNMPRVQQIVDNVTRAMTQFWDQHGAQITAAVSTLMGWLTAFWDNQMRTILDVVTVALPPLTGDWEGAGQTIRGILDRWRDFIGSAFRAITSGVQEIWRSIDWGGIGRAMIEGIGAGIRNAGGWLADQARAAAQAALDAAKNLLGIHSPSTVAARQIGAPFAEGIGVGLEDAMPGVDASAQRMLGDMVAALRGQGQAQPVAVAIEPQATGAAQAGSVLASLLASLRGEDGEGDEMAQPVAVALDRGLGAMLGALLASLRGEGGEGEGGEARGPAAVAEYVFNIAQTFYGQTDAAAVREASGAGVLQALRAAGVR